jgi:succinoglycan biosynthesis transport protein ExoP
VPPDNDLAVAATGPNARGPMAMSDANAFRRPGFEAGHAAISFNDRSFLRELLRTIVRHKLAIGILVLAINVAAIGAALVLEPRYTATAVVIIDRPPPDPVREQTAVNPSNPDASDVESESTVLMSRDVAKEVVESLGLYAKPQHLAWHWRTACAIASLERCTQEGKAPSLNKRIDSFLAALSIRQSGRSRAIEISYTSDEPGTAKAAVTLLLDKYQQFEAEQKSDVLKRTAHWLEDREREMHDTVVAAERKVEEFRARTGLTQSVVDGRSSTVTEQQLANANNQWSQAKTRLAAAQAREEQLKRAIAVGDRGVLRLTDEPVLVSLTENLNQLDNRRTGLVQHYGNRYPDVIAINAQLKELRDKVKAERERALHAAHDEILNTQRETDLLGQNLAELKERSQQLGDSEVQLRALQREADASRSLYEHFLMRAKEAAERAAIVLPAARVVSQATLPDHPSFPSMPRFIAGGLALSAVCALALGLLLEQLAMGYGDLAAMRRELALPLLAVVPYVSKLRHGERAGRYILEHPMSRAGEAIRALGSAVVLAGGGSEAQPSAVMITSATAEEGKSTTSVWLACSAAQSGQNVLLIDGDHRNPSVAKAFGRGSSVGLSEWLNGQVEFSQIIRRDAESNVYFVAAGAPMARNYGASQLFKLRRLIQSLKATYDLIIIDTPPLLAMADALALSHVVDHTIMVCRWQRTHRGAVLGGLRQLREAGAMPTGVVLSMVDTNRMALYSDEYSRRSLRSIGKYYRDDAAPGPGRLAEADGKP